MIRVSASDASALGNDVKLAEEYINNKSSMMSDQDILKNGRERALKAKSQKIPYSTPWGNMYRDPEECNNYGRAWYNTISYRGCPSIYFESYYNYGANASVTYKFTDKKGNLKKVVTKDNGTCTACVDYTNNNKGTFYSVDYYGNGYNFTVRKHYGK